MQNRRRRRRLAVGVAALGVASLAIPLQAGASSHREAPLIAQDPEADNTDVYAFTSPDDASTVTLVANYVPFQRPAGGPNFYPFADDVDYRINVDNVGDGNPHVHFDFSFHTSTVNSGTFLYNTGPISWDPVHKVYTNWNRPQVYTLTMTTDAGGTTVLGGSLLSPPDAVGTRSTGDAADYHELAKHAIHHLPGGVTVFAGQRDDPFFVDLGGVFDLLTLPPFGSPGEDYLTGLNVNSLVLKVPKAMVRGPNDSVIGVWASAFRPSTTTLSATAPFRSTSGSLVQVSRLGSPLVNEVVNDLGHKDAYNASQPIGDKALLESRVLNSELAGLLNAFFGAGAPTTSRTDLLAVFLTGIPGINKPSSGSAVEADELRLNLDTAVSHPNDVNGVNRLGLLAGEADGFPNGRRLADDTTDIELQAVDGILCQSGGPFADGSPCRSGSVPPSLGDGVNANDVPFQNEFPYEADPHSPDTPASPLNRHAGYWLAASDGGIFPFGGALGYGSLGNIHLNKPIVGIATTPDHGGFWLVASDGGIFPFGDAPGLGSLGNVHLNQPVVGMAPTPTGQGYWLVAADGGVFPFGDAKGFGSTGNIHLNKPIVGLAAAPAGLGYWLVASDGGIFPFGPTALGYGSTGGIHLNQPIVGMAAGAGGQGYWLVASDGGIFPFGPGALGYGSTGGIHLNKPIVGMAATDDGGGYWLVAADGGIFPFGDAGGLGSTGNLVLNKPIVGMAGFGSH